MRGVPSRLSCPSGACRLEDEGIYQTWPDKIDGNSASSWCNPTRGGPEVIPWNQINRDRGNTTVVG